MTTNEVKEPSFRRPVWIHILQGALLGALLFSPWLYGLARFRDQLVAELIVLALFLAAFPFLDWPRVFRHGDKTIDVLVFFLLGVGFFYVAFSTLPFFSLVAFLRLLSCVLFYVLIRGAFKSTGELRVALWFVLITGVFYSVYGLVQYYGYLPHKYWYQPWSLASRYVNGGHFGAFLFFPIFIGLSLLISSRNIFVQLLHIAFLLLMGWALLLSRSRMVWIAFLMGLVVFMGIAQQIRLLKGKTVFGLALFILLGGTLLVAQGGVGEIAKRFQELSNAIHSPLDPEATKFYSVVYRFKLWEAASRAIFDNPLGWGLGTFSAIFPQYRVHSDRFFVDYAHNEFFQVGVDLGIPGILLLIVLLFCYLQRAYLFLKKEARSSSKAIAAGFVSLWVGLALVSQFDFPIRIYANALFLMTVLALSTYLFDSHPPSGSRSGRRSSQPGLGLFRPLCLVAVFTATFFVAFHLFAQVHFERGRLLEKDFAWQKALDAYEKAAKLFPFSAEYQEALASLSQKRAIISLNREQKKNLAAKAIDAYRMAIRLHPHKASFHYYLAFAYEAGGDLEQAKSEFKQAIELDPNEALLVSDYGHFALRHSMAKDAVTAFEKLKSIPFQENARTNFCLIVRDCYRLTQDYKDLRRVTPDDSWGHNCLGILLAENNRWDLARIEFDLAIQRAALENHEADMRKRVSDFYLEHSQPYGVNDIYGGVVSS